MPSYSFAVDCVARDWTDISISELPRHLPQTPHLWGNPSHIGVTKEYQDFQETFTNENSKSDLSVELDSRDDNGTSRPAVHRIEIKELWWE
jgi:hypothetical protein